MNQSSKLNKKKEKCNTLLRRLYIKFKFGIQLIILRIGFLNIANEFGWLLTSQFGTLRDTFQSYCQFLDPQLQLLLFGTTLISFISFRRSSADSPSHFGISWASSILKKLIILNFVIFSKHSCKILQLVFEDVPNWIVELLH